MQVVHIVDALDAPDGGFDTLQFHAAGRALEKNVERLAHNAEGRDRKSTRLNSSHSQISYAVFCLKKKKTKYQSVPVVCSSDVSFDRCSAFQLATALQDFLNLDVSYEPQSAPRSNTDCTTLTCPHY